MPSRDVEINLIGNDRTGAATRSAANNLDQLARKIDKFNAKTIGDKKATVKTKVDDSAANRSAEKLKKTFGRAGDQAGQSFRSRLANRIRGFNPDFGRVIDANRRTFGTAGDRAGVAFASRFKNKLKSMTAGIKIKARVDVDKGVARAELLGRRLGNVVASAMGNAITDGTRALGEGVKNMLLKNPQLQPIAALFAARLAGFIGQALTAAFALALGPGLLAAPIAFMLSGAAKASKELEKNLTKQATLRKQLEKAEKGGTKTKAQRQRIADLRKELGILEKQQDKLEKQSAQWQRLKDAARGFMTTISRPLQVPLQAAIGQIERGLDRVQGPLRAIMTALGTALPGFTKGAMDLFLNFIKALEPALPGIVAGMKAWATELPKIGTAFGNMIAKIMANPDQVVTAVQNVSAVLQSLASGAGSIISGLTRMGNAFFAFETNIDALENKNLGGLTNAFGGAFRQITSVIFQEVIQWLSLLSKFLNAWALINPLMRGPAAAVANTLAGVTADFANVKQKWFETDEAFRRRQIKAKITADIAGLQSKLAEAKAKLKDPTLSKAKKIQIQANIADLKLKVALGKAALTQLGKKKTKPKLEADKARLEKAVRQGKAALKTVQDKKTEAKIKADISAAQAGISKINGQLNALNGKTATVHVVYSQSTTGSRPRTNGSVGGVPKNASAGPSWQGALSGGSTSRTGGATQVNVAAPTVDTRVFLDSREIRVVARSAVMDENRRNAYRARVGRR